MTTTRRGSKATQAAPIEPPAETATEAAAVDQQAVEPAPQAPADAAPLPKSAPLEPPPPAAAAEPDGAPAGPLMAPVPAVPAGTTFLGFVDGDGLPVDPDGMFDTSGIGSVVVAQQRIYVRTRRPGSKAVLTMLAFPAGMEVERAAAQDAIEQARAARD